MNRLHVGVIGVVLGLLLPAAEAEAQVPPQRFAYVNSQRIMAEAPGTAEAQRTFEADMATYRAELERLETELETLQENFDRQQGTLSATAREQRQQEMQQKFIAYQQRSTELEETAQRRQAELVGPIMDRVSAVIELVRVEGNYTGIIDAASGVFLAVDPTIDLTNQVLERLRMSAVR